MEKHAMADVESLSTQNNAVLMSLGATVFSRDGIVDTFYRVIDPHTCQRIGMHIDANTVLWWFGQSDAARQALCTVKGMEIRQAITEFQEFMVRHNVVHLWGNGSDFDNVILDNYFRRLSIKRPWSHLGNRCYRTLKNLHSDVKHNRAGERHNALDDSIFQTEHLLRILNIKDLELR